MIATADRPGLAQFVARLLRLDPAAVVRLRPEPDGQGCAWAMLPFRVLVGRRLSQPSPADVTVRAADLSAALTSGGANGLARWDEAWRWPLPSSPGRAVEHLEDSIVFGVDRQELRARARGLCAQQRSSADHALLVGQRHARALTHGLQRRRQTGNADDPGHHNISRASRARGATDW